MTNKKNILVTGANGQLGNELRALSASYPAYHFLFVTKEELPVTEADEVRKYFKRHTVHVCINCAAYTAVDKAETEKEKAFLVNATAAGNLASTCAQFNTQLIHISTDYVFDGTLQQPYQESDPTCPINTYGASKLKGEELALQNDPTVIIIRTSWVYSSFGNNFVKTMLRLMKEKDRIDVVNDQWGCPTYAADLAEAIMVIVEKWTMGNRQRANNIFNYTNRGIITWYEFAFAIKELTGSNCFISPIPTSQYPTAAKRPPYSVLDISKIQQQFNINIPDWKERLQKCLLLLS